MIDFWDKLPEEEKRHKRITELIDSDKIKEAFTSEVHKENARKTLRQARLYRFRSLGSGISKSLDAVPHL